MKKQQDELLCGNRDDASSLQTGGAHSREGRSFNKRFNKEGARSRGALSRKYGNRNKNKRTRQDFKQEKFPSVFA